MANKATEDLDPAGLPLDGTEAVHVVKDGNSRQTTTEEIARLAVGITEIVTAHDFGSAAGVGASGYNGGIWFGNLITIDTDGEIDSVVYDLQADKSGINGTPGIYANNAGAPGALLAVGPTVANGVTGDNVLPLTTPLAVSAGDQLWVGCYQELVFSISATYVGSGAASVYTTETSLPLANPAGSPNTWSARLRIFARGSAIATVETIGDAPSDGEFYARKDAAWETFEPGAGGITDAPSDGTTYGRKDGAWEAVSGSSGSGAPVPALSARSVRTGGGTCGAAGWTNTPMTSIVEDDQSWYDGTYGGFKPPAGKYLVIVNIGLGGAGIQTAGYAINGAGFYQLGHNNGNNFDEGGSAIVEVDGTQTISACGYYTSNVAFNNADCRLQVVEIASASVYYGSVIKKTSLRLAAPQAIAHNTAVNILWDVEESDETNSHNTTNKDRVVIPIGAKRFRAALFSGWDGHNTGDRQLQITSSGARGRIAYSYMGGGSQWISTSSADTGWIEVDGVNFVPGTTYLVATVVQSSGTTLNFNGDSSGNAQGNFYVEWDFGIAAATGASGSRVVNDSTTARNILAADSSAYLRFTNAAAKTLTVQTDATEPLFADSEWNIRNAGAGDLTIDPDVGVTINPPGGGSLVVPEGGTVTLKRVAVDEFDLIGQTIP